MDTSVQTLLNELVAAGILLVPVVAGLAYTYLKTQENKRAIQSTPTYHEVNSAIDSKINELGLNGKDGTDGTTQTSGSTGTTSTGS